jgi:hypothetical protein
MSTFCLKVMVVSIVLYDHIDPNGAFYRNSPINVSFFFFFFFFFFVVMLMAHVKLIGTIKIDKKLCKSNPDSKSSVSHRVQCHQFTICYPLQL